jgi:UPF0716 protein FxsA
MRTAVKGRPGWVLPVVAVLLVALPILEVWLLIQVGQVIGVLPTLAILVAEAAVGAWLMRREGTRAWRALNDAFAQGRMPTAELADAALVLVGGVLLMLPGFATDVLGFLCLVPVTRPLVRRLLELMVTRRLERTGLPVVRAGAGRSTVVEGEVVESTQPDGAAADPRVIQGEVEGAAKDS